MLSTPPMPHGTFVLFLCTGNYYRSRYAELLFNHLAREHGVSWYAESAGLAPQCFTRNPGVISRFTRAALQTHGIALPEPVRAPRDVDAQLLSAAGHIIALKEKEHRPLMRERFPAWEERVEYWHVHDLDAAMPEQALPEIEGRVRALIERLPELTRRAAR